MSFLELLSSFIPFGKKEVSAFPLDAETKKELYQTALEKRLAGNESRIFMGKAILLDEALETTHELVDYFEALKNRKTLTKKPNADLSYLLRCNSITSMHLQTANSGLVGIKLRNWSITPDQVVFTWLFAHKMETRKPLCTLGEFQIRMSNTNTL